MVDVLLVAVALAAVVLGRLIGYFVGRVLTARAKEFEFRERERAARRESFERSRASLSGHFLEKLAPFPDFTHDPSEVRFIGTPVDHVVFCGMGTGRMEDVVFLEVKTGKPRLSAE